MPLSFVCASFTHFLITIKAYFLPFQVSDDESYASDVSDNISEDNLSNDIENERQTIGRNGDFYLIYVC